mgnify:CR=1 FL=1
MKFIRFMKLLFSIMGEIAIGAILYPAILLYCVYLVVTSYLKRYVQWRKL